jgi:hypothetical protein
MSEENQPETEEITAADVGEITAEDLGVNDPVETTGDGTPAADSIEAAADAAAAEEPEPAAEPEPAEPEPEPAPEPAETKAAAKGKAKPTARKRQTASKRGKDTSASQAHLAAKKAARPKPEPAPPISEEDQAKIDLKVKTRERLREIKEAIEVLDGDKQALIDERDALMNPEVTGDTMTFVERHRQVLARSKEIREKRVRDRLTLLAAGAGKSPLDQSLASRPRASLADADKPDPAAE